MPFPHHVKGAARIELGRLWGGRSAAKRRLTVGEPDDYTLRMRALHDAKGHVVREGATYRASGVTHWQVRRAVEGRIDMFEFVANGRVKLCAGPRRFPREFRP